MEQWNNGKNGTTAQVNLANEKVILRQLRQKLWYLSFLFLLTSLLALQYNEALSNK
jgi:hypothetical protein